MHLHWTATLLVLVAAAGPWNLGGQAAKENKPMDLTPYKLPDELFWTTTNRSSDPMAIELIGEYSGVLVGAPGVVRIDQRRTLPAAVYYLGPVRQVAGVKWDDHGIITAIDLEQNRLYAIQGRALITEPDPVPRRPPKLNELPKGSLATVRSLDLRAFFKMPWVPSRFLVTALLRDQVSNRAAVELRRSESAYEDPEVIKHKQAERARAVPRPPEPPRGSPLPGYHRLQESPALPEENGIKLAPTRVVDLGRGARAPLYASFRLPVLPQERVKPGYVEPRATAATGLPEPRPLAVINISLLVTGADDGSLFVLPMRVPAYTRVPSTDDRLVVTGYFALDLLQFGGMPTDAQTYFVYAFSGESMAGPAPCALVGRDPRDEE